MRASLTLLRTIVAWRRRSIDGLHARRHARHVVVICAAALTGCAQDYSDYTESIADGRPAAHRRSASKKSIPLPSQALLAPQDKPDCESTVRHLPSSGASAAVAPTPAPTTPETNADLTLRIKLEYERECYRQAEARVREQLRKLQASASDTIKAVKHLEHDLR